MPTETSTTVLPGAAVYKPHQEQSPTTPLDMQQIVREAEEAARKQSTKKDNTHVQTS